MFGSQVTVRPVLLPPHPVQHTYVGGDRIAALRGVTQLTDHQPEEWLGSTVSRFGDDVVGLAVIEGGEYLRDVVAAEPVAWVGPNLGHDASDTGLLVKLLDPRQRLPVHVHPDRSFAATHLDCPYGKTEAWYVLAADPGAAVYVGWAQDVRAAEVDSRRKAQDSDWLLANLNRVDVQPGTGVLVPAGTAHAIDAGVLVLEVQEPTDWSILIERWITTASEPESHLGIGFDLALQAVSYAGLDHASLAALLRQTTSFVGASLLPAAADPFFRMTGLVAGNTQAPGFAVVLVVEGAGALESESHDAVEVRDGEAYAIPHGWGSWRLTGDARVIACAPGAGWPATLR